MDRKNGSFYEDLKTLFMLYIAFVVFKWIFWDTPIGFLRWLFGKNDWGIRRIYVIAASLAYFTFSFFVALLLLLPFQNSFDTSKAIAILTLALMAFWPIGIALLILRSNKKRQEKEAEDAIKLKEKHANDAAELKVIYEEKLAEIIEYARKYSWYNKSANSTVWLIERIAACSTETLEANCGLRLFKEVMHWSTYDDVRKSMFMFEIFRGKSFSDEKDELILQCDCLFSFVDGKMNPVLIEHLKAKRALERNNRKANVAKK